MPFRFRFQVLLEQREHLFEEAQAVLAEAERRHETLQDAEKLLHDRITGHHTFLKETMSRGVGVAQYLAFRHSLTALEQELLSITKEVEASALEVEQKKQLLFESKRELRKVELLKAKEKDLYREREKKWEQKQLDEIALNKEFGKAKQ